MANLEVRKARKGKSKSIVNQPSSVKSLPAAVDAVSTTILTSVQPILEAERFTELMVRKLRKTLRMSQTELAQAVGKSQSWVRDLENKLGDRPVPLEYADQLQQILGLRPS